MTEQKHNTQTKTNTFHARIENLTKIAFTNDDIQLLSKGFKYNL
jgi:hypothetical protein